MKKIVLYVLIVLSAGCAANSSGKSPGSDTAFYVVQFNDSLITNGIDTFIALRFVRASEIRNALEVTKKPKEDERVLVAKKAFEEKVLSESGGMITVTSFSKSNGHLQTGYSGYSVYVLEWSANLYIQKDVWKRGNGFEGYWQTFFVFTEKKNSDAFANEYKLFTSGPVSMSGECRMTLTDNGWRAGGFTVKRTTK